jgi:uncharacterized damage-inducible protein DinB
MPHMARTSKLKSAELLPNLPSSILSAWRTNNRVTMQLIASLPDALLNAPIPNVQRRTVRTIVAHLHNSRCSWLKTLGSEHGIAVPDRVDRSLVTKRQLVAALKDSSAGMEKLLKLGLDRGGNIPQSKGYVWRNLSLDVGHVLTYFVGHEAHHRGQIVMLARITGHPLPVKVVGALWWWRDAKTLTTKDTKRHKGNNLAL